MTLRELLAGAIVAVGAAGAGYAVTHAHARPSRPSPTAPTTSAAGRTSLPLVAAPGGGDLASDFDHDVVRTKNLMGTVVTIKIRTEALRPAEEAAAAAFDEIARLEDLMTTWRPTSVISRLNAAAGKSAVTLDPDTLAVLVRCHEMAELTGGLFDPTVGVYAGIWKFDQDNDGSLPDPATVRALLPLVSWRDILIDPATKSARLRRPGEKITLGGIAKGYAVDRAVAVIARRGFVDFVVQAGGDMYVSGRHGDRPWRVGIRDPRGPEGSAFAYMDLEDETFSTSGDYERFVLRDGTRYHHLLDPRTGFPAMASRSVTVVAHDAFTADGLSKALFILGPTGGEPLLAKAGVVGAVWVTGDNRVVISPALEGRVHILHPPTGGP